MGLVERFSGDRFSGLRGFFVTIGYKFYRHRRADERHTLGTLPSTDMTYETRTGVSTQVLSLPSR